MNAEFVVRIPVEPTEDEDFYDNDSLYAERVHLQVQRGGKSQGYT